MMWVVGTASRKASLSPMFCSYSDFFLFPFSGFWYNDLMTLRAAKYRYWGQRYTYLKYILITYNTGGRHWREQSGEEPSFFPPVWYNSSVPSRSSTVRRTTEKGPSSGVIRRRRDKDFGCWQDLNSIYLHLELNNFGRPSTHSTRSCGICRSIETRKSSSVHKQCSCWRLSQGCNIGQVLLHFYTCYIPSNLQSQYL